MTKEEWIREQNEDDDFGFRLASMSKRNTGLPMVILIDMRDAENKNTPRLLFNDSYEDSWKWETLVPISLDKKNPDILLKGYPQNLTEHTISVLKEWIKSHYEGLMKVWNSEISESEYCVSCAKSYHTANAIERLFERVDDNYYSALEGLGKDGSRYSYYAQGFLDGMRYMNWKLTQNPDKESLEKLLALNMFEKSAEEEF